MSLRVNFKVKYGEVVLVQKDPDELGTNKKRTFRIGIYMANAVCAFCTKRKDENGQTLYDLQGFFGDYKHVERLTKHKIEMFWGKVTKVRLNTFWQSKYRADYNAIIKYFTRMDAPVTLYYKEVKIHEQKRTKIKNV